MRKSIGLCSWRALAGGLAVGVIAWSVSVDAASRNAGARDQGQVKSASRLVTSPVNQVAREINEGGVASGALLELKWLAPQGSLAAAYPDGTSAVGGTELTIPGAGPDGQPLWLGLFMSGWDDQFTSPAQPCIPTDVCGISNVQGTLDNSALPAGLSVHRPGCLVGTDCASPLACNQHCIDQMGPGGGSGCNVAPITDNTCGPAMQDLGRADAFGIALAGQGLSTTACAIATDNISCGANVGGGNDNSYWDDGTVQYVGTFVLVADQSLVGGPHSVDLLPPNGSTFMSDGDVTLKIAGLTLKIETGSCCFGISPGQAASCAEDVSRTDCASRAPANSFRKDTGCPTGLGGTGGPACAECFNPGQPDPACADEITGVTGDNQCTDNFCDNSNLCQNPNIAGWDDAEDCCDPTDASFTAIDDDDSCTDDSCSLGSGLGTADHENSEPGTSCDDGNACTHTDECGDGDGICTGDDINDDTCDPATNADCVALIPGTTCGEDGTCACSLNPDMTCEITPGKLPKHAECIGGVNNGEKCVDDDDCPGQVNPPIFAGFCDNQACFHENAKVEAFVHISPALVAINGFQVTVNYDPSCMQLVSVDPVFPFVQVLDTQIDEAAGEIFMAAGVAFGGADGPFGDADLMRISWLKTGECSTCNCSFGGANPVNTYLTDADGQPLNVIPKPSQTIVSAGLLSLDLPGSVKSNVECDSVTVDISWDKPSAVDTCGVQDFACEGHHAQKGKVIDHLVNTGGEHIIGDSTYCCWATNKCGAFAGFKVGDPRSNSAEGCWTVTVNDQTALDIEIELSPTIAKKVGGVVRCIEFEAFANTVQGPLVFCDDITFGGNFNLIGHSSGLFKMPPGEFKCLTARDKLHTLRACALRSDDNLDCVGGTVFATFKGDPFFGGNWLINGNLDAWKKDNPKASHDVIDIQDFGQFVANYLQCYFDGEKVSCSAPTNGNTPCSGTNHKDFDCHAMDQTNADINGDGIADLLDFGFVSFNFLASSKDCCFPGSTGNTAARTAISVVELRQMGLSDLIVADLNNDGMLDLNDMSAFLAGEVPSRKGIQRSRTGLRSTGRK